MKSNLFNILGSIFMVALVLLPISTQLVHALEEEHHHEICDAKEVKHIHADEQECAICHMTIDFASFDETPTFEIIPFSEFQTTFYTTYKKASSPFTTFRSTRAPPALIS
ncbi:hypothetical protein [Aureivirga sp. CE67]|uniref:hypothetical protein n=1 Tax=Aureivirga sp. CE67 TaxID=1788983 RepID=UPI0018C9F5D5|nr:hypothetical protein [Aureivirga sp. CE67]